MSSSDWTRIAHAKGQAIGEKVAIACGLALVPVAWLTEARWIVAIAGPILVSGLLRVLNTARYGVWIRVGEMNFRGYLSTRVMPAERVERVVIDPGMAELLVRVSGEWKATYVGFIRISDRETERIAQALYAWLEESGSTVAVELPSPGMFSWKESLTRGYNSRGGVPYGFEPPRAWHWAAAIGIVVTSILLGVALEHSAAASIP